MKIPCVLDTGTLLIILCPETLKAANSLNIPYVGYVLLDFEVAGVKIREKEAIIVKDTCQGADKTVLGMNIIFSCWKSIFQENIHPGMSAFRVTVSSSALGHWEQAFAACSCVTQEESADGKIGVARLTRQSLVEIPPQSETVVWAQVQGDRQLSPGPLTHGGGFQKGQSGR